MTTPNEQYLAAWTALRDWRADHAARRRAVVEEYHRLLAPPGKKSVTAKKRAAIDATYRPLADLLAEERRQMEAAAAALPELAARVAPAPEGWGRVDDAYDASYGSQTQASLYARHWLTPQAEHLDRLGFRTELTRGEHGWELWADCPEWQYEVLRARLPLAESLACWTRHGVNVRVYLPTLPYDRVGGY